MHWFGPYRGGPFCDGDEHVPTPIGTPCHWCQEPIADGDSGDILPCVDAKGRWSLVPRHQECALRSVVGGVNHILGKCICCGGDQDPDPPEMSRRDAAKAAFRLALWRRL